MSTIVRKGEQVSTRFFSATECLVAQEAYTRCGQKREYLFMESDHFGTKEVGVLDPTIASYYIDEQELYLFIYTISSKGIQITKLLNLVDWNLIDVAKVTDEFINENTTSMNHRHGNYRIKFEVVDGCYQMKKITDRQNNEIELKLIESTINLECFGKNLEGSNNGKCKRHTI